MTSQTQALKQHVRDFWDSIPCDTKDVPHQPGSPAFFEHIERRRYADQFHIPLVAQFEASRGRNVLDVGGGIGTDARQFAHHSANVTLLDISRVSLELAQKAFEQRGLRANVVQGDSENLPIKSSYFDIVWSHGSLHHTPNTQRAVEEVYRVLKPGGEAVVMLYHRDSYDYWVHIRLLRKLALRLMLLPGGMAIVHRLTGLKREFLAQYEAFAKVQAELKIEEYVSQNTDGLGNPLSRVYSRRQATEFFRSFRNVSASVYYMNRRNLMLLGRFLPRWSLYLLGRAFGFFLYIRATK